MPDPGSTREIPAASVRPLHCPNCGASVILRSFGRAVNVVCGSCHSVLDAQHPEVQILQKFQSAQKYTPLIPLGTRGKLGGVLYEVIGFQRREILVEGLSYGWDEYLLFNPYKGFRYLTEYQGHWNNTSMLRSLPEAGPSGDSLSYLGQTYRHFQTAEAKTVYVLGEFPWQVRVRETARVTDYICPPRVLSSETTKDKEVTWSLGEYMSGPDIWKIFSLPGEPPPAVGVYENQPTPLNAATRAIWQLCAAFLAVALLFLIFNLFTSQDHQVFSNRYIFNASTPATEPSFVTDIFELTGRPSQVRVDTTTSVNNNWIYLNYTLINDDTGQAYDFGREASYYSGYDSDGSWSEGSRNDSVMLPGIPAGHYYLRIEPEGERGHEPVVYTVTVTQGV